MTISRRMLLLGAAAVASAPMLAHAQSTDLQAKPIRIVVAYGAGGASDALARYAADSLTKAIGQRVIVENRPGADGNIAAEAVATAPDRDITLLVSGVSTHATNVTIYKRLPFDPEKDFFPLTTIASTPYLLVVNPERIQAKTFKDFLAEAGKAGRPLTYASANVGGRLAGELFKKLSGVSAENVAYRSSAQAMTDLLGQQYDYYFCDMVTAMPQIRAGKIRALAVSSKEPVPMLPDVPTLAALGYPGFDVSSWIAIWSSAKAPPAVSAELANLVNQAFASPEGREFMMKIGLLSFPGSPQSLGTLQKRDTEAFRGLIIEAGMQQD
mgnify:CR=1 FL=1